MDGGGGWRGVVWIVIERGTSVRAAVRPSSRFSAGYLRILSLPGHLRAQDIEGRAGVA